MLRLKTTIILICLVPALAVAQPPSPVPAADTDAEKAAVSDPAASQQEQENKAGTKSAKKAVAKRKKLRKKARKTVHAAAAEKPTGDTMTVQQVLAVLKDSRDLSGKNLKGLQLVGVNLSKCNLKGADLSRANLERADLTESNLERTDLAGANLRMASLRQAGMTAANLDQVILDGAIWKDGSICAKGSLGQCLQ
ncbi:pentapeptide repeat-containing protein [Geobacter sp. SVR]|uniref:pentapeptide repeat-containing protein n=1 Tax=Geobacter sp. SVR TaxID=2495594 RepID=UPI00143EFA03|nr:pentapeptide repeat-containing protein [Geobacter sp. SVR]BCS53637.1 hypothetical protein GSVR_19450 [Geobacter sp. SVR]GCF84166.1 hypothetical protein GSbR_07660 [Geobacter sp. SVR]